MNKTTSIVSTLFALIIIQLIERTHNLALAWVRYLHDTLRLLLADRMTSLFQRGTNWADGGDGVNQCPIASGKHLFPNDFSRSIDRNRPLVSLPVQGSRPGRNILVSLPPWHPIL